MTLGPLFDHQQAHALKEAGMASAMAHAGDAFAERACALIQAVHAGDVILAEQWRQTCVEQGVVPHHPNAWGALTSVLRKRGIIKDTGKYKTAQSVRNHGHSYRLWQVRSLDW